ncbi:hypothetical protein HNQ60_000700 [Povalibacter uvarum]|uniref:Ice-binding protein C-terminal domain-containing protein n=1 Tax=Povalibacter uvarum TaxID=732238 RepID=A0A841HH11_9GAMM|nr:PEP-CTERM sorting domain-containing protein [Povalibacter uvarum]MBB6091854.1 hypothetical protein [Povalibacter uvarum]
MRRTQFALGAAALLASASALAIPVTYEFTALLEVSQGVENPGPAHGYITFETNPVVTDSTDPIDYTNKSGTEWNSYDGALLSAYMEFGSDELYVAGGTSSTGATYKNFWNDQSPVVEYAAGTQAQSIDGRYFSFSYDRRCIPPDNCLDSTFESLLANADLNDVHGMYAGLGVVLRVRNALLDPTVLQVYTATTFRKVPEPSTLGLLVLGLLGAAARRRPSKK